jgi:hypothetical protein
MPSHLDFEASGPWRDTNEARPWRGQESGVKRSTLHQSSRLPAEGKPNREGAEMMSALS